MKPARFALVGALAALAAVAMTACPQPPNPAPMPPDATDGAPWPGPVTPDAGTCAAGCNALAAAGCPTEVNCPSVYAHFESANEKRTPGGQILTCAMVAAVHTKADAVALGIGCP